MLLCTRRTRQPPWPGRSSAIGAKQVKPACGLASSRFFRPRQSRPRAPRNHTERSAERIKKWLQDSNCLSFQIRSTPLHRLELYDLVADPSAGRDLSRSETELTRWMTRRLQQLRWSPVAVAGTRTLSDEARETLRALGYLD